MDADGAAVLQFLLGKTSAMSLEDTRSATSTSSSLASDATSAGSSASSGVSRDEEDAPDAKAVGDPVGADGDGDGHPPELQPICEDESEQEEEEEEEEMGTDHESTDDEREEEQTPAEKEETLAEEGDQEEAPAKDDDEKRDVLVETTAGTESEVEDEDGCRHVEDAPTTGDSSSASCDPLHSDIPTGEKLDAIKCSDTRAASSPSTEKESEAIKTEPAAPEKASGAPSLGEMLLVSVVAVALLAYVVACTYSFLYRDTSGAVVLPDVSRFERPVDMTNVSLRILSPANHSAVSPPLLRLDWQLENFPADALRAGGLEVHRYDVFINDQRLMSEVALLELTPSEKQDESIATLNRSMTQYIRWEKLDASAHVHTVRIDVQVPIPGAFDQVMTFSQSLVLANGQKATGEVGAGAVVIKTPADGAHLQPNEDLVLTYVAGEGVTRLRVGIDGAFVAWKTHVDVGVLLLHGLGEGTHVIALEAVGEADGEVESSASVRVRIGAS